MNLRSKILNIIYKLFPFNLKGDLEIGDNNPDYDISCVINFYGRINMLRNILSSLCEQDLSRESFEVLLVEDRGGTKEGREIAEKFKSLSNIKYFALSVNHGRMGYSRNFGLSKTSGKIILFLDDDTVILQKNFLSTLINEFEILGADAVIPRGGASYCLVKGRYDFHDPYFPTNRCMAYRRDALGELGGFVSEIIGQEDVEFLVRFSIAGMKFSKSRKLYYLHPPLILNSVKKAAAVGKSFANLKKRYPLIIWLMLLMNGSRYLPLFLFPVNKKLRTQFRFSLGFIIGALYALTGRETEYQ
jgi:glycosyltransferase involved in cell wall biosynthesis